MRLHYRSVWLQGNKLPLSANATGTEFVFCDSTNELANRKVALCIYIIMCTLAYKSSIIFANTTPFCSICISYLLQKEAVIHRNQFLSSYLYPGSTRLSMPALP